MYQRLIADEQFLLLTDVPIQDHAQQLEIYEVFNLVILHRNFSACYIMNSKYLGITYNEARFQYNSLVYGKRLMDNFAALMRLFNHLQIHHHVSQQYMQRTRLELRNNGHYKSGMSMV